MISLDKIDQCTTAPSDLVDSSIRLVLNHRVGAQRADELLADVADGVEFANLRLGAAIGSWNGLRPTTSSLLWDAPLGGDVYWSGERLTVPARFPDVVHAAVVGRAFADVFMHPAVPTDRLVDDTVQGPGVVILMCRPDLVSVASLVRRHEPNRVSRRRRAQERRELLNQATDGSIHSRRSFWDLLLEGPFHQPPIEQQVEATRRKAVDLMIKACAQACDTFRQGPLADVLRKAA